MLLQGWKHLTKILFPPHCCYPLISRSGQSLTDHLANGSPISLCVQTFNLLEDFRAQLPGFSVPGLVIFCNSDVSWSHHSQVTPCILSLFGSLIIKLNKNQNNTRTPSEHDPVFFQPSSYFSNFAFHHLYFYIPISPCLYFFSYAT